MLIAVAIITLIIIGILVYKTSTSPIEVSREDFLNSLGEQRIYTEINGKFYTCDKEKNVRTFDTRKECIKWLKY